MNAYEAAGGRVVGATRGVPLDASAMPCLGQWVELRYYHCDGSPVSGARYFLEAEGFSVSGVLDDDGFTRVEGVPAGIGQVAFRFEEDPEEYAPRPPEARTDTAASRNGLQQVFDGTVDWIWGTIQGDFNPDPSISQIAVNTVIGLIPIADQALDVRDLIAGIKNLIQYYMEEDAAQQAHPDSLGLSYETWLWLGLFLIALGCIPEFGSAIKGLLKALIRKLQDAGQAATRLDAQSLRRIWESVIATLNHLGVSQGNAHRWLKQLLDRIGSHMDDAATRIRNAAEILRNVFDNVAAQVNRLYLLFPEWAQATLKKLEDTRRAIGRLLDSLEHQKQRLNTWLREQLERIIGSRGASDGVAHTNVHPSGTGTDLPSNEPNQVVQSAEPPPEPDLPPVKKQIIPGGDLAAHEAAGGHLLQRHVGKTEAELTQRLVDQPSIPAASTFRTATEAEEGVGAVLDAKAPEIAEWVNNGAQGKRAFEAPFSGGQVMLRGASTPTVGSGVRLVLQGDGSGGWYILTGFPIP